MFWVKQLRPKNSYLLTFPYRIKFLLLSYCIPLFNKLYYFIIFLKNKNNNVKVTKEKSLQNFICQNDILYQKIIQTIIFKRKKTSIKKLQKQLFWV